MYSNSKRNLLFTEPVRKRAKGRDHRSIEAGSSPAAIHQKRSIFRISPPSQFSQSPHVAPEPYKTDPYRRLTTGTYRTCTVNFPISRVTMAVVTTLRRTKSLVKFSAKNSEANHGWPWNVDGKARYGDDATMRRCDDATMRRCDDTILFW